MLKLREGVEPDELREGEDSKLREGVVLRVGVSTKRFEDDPMERWGVLPKLREGAVPDEGREGVVVKVLLEPVPLLCPWPLPLPPKLLRPLPEDMPGVGGLEPLPMPPWLLPPCVPPCEPPRLSRLSWLPKPPPWLPWPPCPRP